MLIARSWHDIAGVRAQGLADKQVAARLTRQQHGGGRHFVRQAETAQRQLGGLGAWGEWNVGSWCDDVQRKWIEQDI